MLLSDNFDGCFYRCVYQIPHWKEKTESHPGSFHFCRWSRLVVVICELWWWRGGDREEDILSVGNRHMGVVLELSTLKL
jgi:hypothetical protein